MNDAKYIGLDVHQATISIAILDSAGKLVMEAILETKTASGEICMNESSHRNSTGSETPSMRRPFDESHNPDRYFSRRARRKERLQML
jgi:hypothetical protein